MVQFATVDDLAAYMQTSFDDESRIVAADQAMSLASASIQNETGQHLAFVEDDVVTFTVDGTARRLFLPELPVTAVSAVSIDGVELLTTDYTVEAATGLLRRIYDGLWLSWLSTGATSVVSVTYGHGFDPIPDDIKGECLRRAASLMNNPDGNMASETIGTYSYTASDATTGGEYGRCLIARYRVVTVA